LTKKITIKEAAETVGVSARTIRRYIASGRIPAYRLGPRMIRVDADQLTEQLHTPVTGGAA